LITLPSPNLRAPLLAGCFSLLAVGCGEDSESAFADPIAMGGSYGATASGGGATSSGRAATAGRPATGGSSASMAGAASMPSRPPPTGAPADVSVYSRECRGDTLECGAPEVFSCLGLRDDHTVFGFACSKPCETDADCGVTAADGAAPACLDFTIAKHCLLRCLSNGVARDCPAGMGCSVYPGATVGYCLWH
jgi:hypothetical protein